MPKKGPIAEGLRAEFERLVRKHGYKDTIPLYEENGVYNFYVKKHNVEHISNVSIAPVTASPTPSEPASSGNVRQVLKP